MSVPSRANRRRGRTDAARIGFGSNGSQGRIARCRTHRVAQERLDVAPVRLRRGTVDDRQQVERVHEPVGTEQLHALRVPADVRRIERHVRERAGGGERARDRYRGELPAGRRPRAHRTPGGLHQPTSFSTGLRARARTGASERNAGSATIGRDEGHDLAVACGASRRAARGSRGWRPTRSARCRACRRCTAVWVVSAPRRARRRGRTGRCAEQCLRCSCRGSRDEHALRGGDAREPAESGRPGMLTVQPVNARDATTSSRCSCRARG